MAKKTDQERREGWQKTREKGVKKYQARIKAKVLVPVKKNSPVLKSKTSTPPEKKSKLRYRTPKEAARYRKYLKIRKVWFQDEENQICKLHMTEECRMYGEPACEVHHTQGTIGDKLCDISTWLPGSGRCHRLAHDKDKEAKERGSSGLRLTK